MTQKPNPIPLRPRPDYPSARTPNYAERATYGAALARATNKEPHEVFDRLYPDDRVSPAQLTRTAVAPGTTSASGWASQLMQTAVGGYLGSLANVSAAAALMSRGVSIELNDNSFSAINIPVRTGAYTPHFVAELSPIPVRTDALTSAWSGSQDRGHRRNDPRSAEEIG